MVSSAFSNHSTQNFLWDLPWTDVYAIIGLDPLHQLDIGIWGYHIMTWLKTMIESRFNKSKAASKLAIINNRFSRIPEYPGLRIFKKGVTELANTSAVEWRAVQRVSSSIKEHLMILGCIQLYNFHISYLQSILPCIRGILEDQVLEDKVCEAIRYFLDFRTSIELYYPTEESLNIINETLKKFQVAVEVFQPYSPCDMDFSKMHSLAHYAAQMKMFGSPKGTTSAFGEAAHKIFAKAPFEMTNKHDEIPQVCLKPH